jgi:hypothetical protein
MAYGFMYKKVQLTCNGICNCAPLSVKYATMAKGLLTQSKTCNKMAKDVMCRSPTYCEMARGVMCHKVKFMQDLHTMGNISL